MTLEQLETILKSTGYPAKYSHFDIPPTLPYINYLVVGSNNVMADNAIYLNVNSYRVELYTKTKDASAENKVESIFETNGIIFAKSEVYINSEKLFLIIYEFEEME